MGAKLSLYLHRDPYDQQGTEGLFLKAMEENLAYHRRKSKAYRQILRCYGAGDHGAGYHGARYRGSEHHQAERCKMRYRGEADQLLTLRSMEDLERIPPLTTALFKRQRLWTLKERQMRIKATSSGTSGRKSEMGFDLESVFFGGLMTLSLGRYHRLFSRTPANYLMLGYAPHPTDKRIITKTQKITSLFAPPASYTYALHYQKGGYHLDLEGLLEGLERYGKSPLPVRIVGFPSYLFFLLEHLQEQGRRYRLPPGSMVLLGGGWKEHRREMVDKEELYQRLEETLQIPESQVREFFGAAEHPSLYCACPRHHFHVPIYSRVIIRDVKTLEPLGPGEPGLLDLLTPLAKGMPLLSVMTDDLAVLHEGGSCGCAIKTPYFEILGRAGLEEIWTCAAGAEELLKAGHAPG